MIVKFDIWWAQELIYPGIFTTALGLTHLSCHFALRLLEHQATVIANFCQSPYMP